MIGDVRLEELDQLWYKRLHPILPSGEVEAIARFAYGILKEMVKLSLMGYEDFPEAQKDYIFEKVVSIIQRARLEEEVLKEMERRLSPPPPP
jgi:hypothetical protein